jgi:hypothetical protein
VNERELAEKIENLENIQGTSQPLKTPKEKLNRES